MSQLCEVEGAVYVSVVLGCQEMARGVLCWESLQRWMSPVAIRVKDPDMELYRPNFGLSDTLGSS